LPPGIRVALDLCWNAPPGGGTRETKRLFEV
jgi:hypothetical protein